MTTQVFAAWFSHDDTPHEDWILLGEFGTRAEAETCLNGYRGTYDNDGLWIEEFARDADGRAVTVREVSVKEGRALFDRWCREEIGVNGDDFLTHYDRGEAYALGPEDSIDDLAMLIPFARP